MESYAPVLKDILDSHSPEKFNVSGFAIPSTTTFLPHQLYSVQGTILDCPMVLESTTPSGVHCK